MYPTGAGKTSCTLNIADVDVWYPRPTTSAKPFGKKYRASLICYIWRADDGSLSMLPFSPALSRKLLKPFVADAGGCGDRTSP